MRLLLTLLTSFLILSACNQTTSREIPVDFDYGVTHEGRYQNRFFKLKVNFDTNWNVLDQEENNALMQEGSEMIFGEDNEEMIKAADVASAQLLSLFRYQMEGFDTLGIMFNPSFLIVAENLDGLGSVDSKGYLEQVRALSESAEGQPMEFESAINFVTYSGKEFATMKATSDLIIAEIKQIYYLRVVNGFALGFILTGLEDQMEELEQIMKSVEIEL